MSEGWETARLGDLCSFQNGLWKGKKPPYVQVGVLRNTNFAGDGSLNMLPEQIAFLDVEERHFAKRSLRSGDIILEKSGGGPKQPVGRVALFTGPENAFSLSNFTSRCRIEDTTLLDPAFLHRFLHYCYVSGKTKTMQSHSTGIRNLKLDEYKELEIPLPPLDEQRRIVAKLDGMSAEVADLALNLSRSVESDRRIRVRALEGAFAGNAKAELEETRLGDVCRLINGRAYKKTEFLDDGPFPVLRVGNFFTNRNWVYSDLDLPEDKYCESGDLLYAWSASFGPRVWEGPKSIFHYHIWKVVPDTSKVTTEYLYRLLQWDVEQIRKDHGTGSTMIHVTKGSMEARPIRIPPIHVQEEICSTLSILDESLNDLQKRRDSKFAAVNALMPSLLGQLIGSK